MKNNHNPIIHTGIIRKILSGIFTRCEVCHNCPNSKMLQDISEKQARIESMIEIIARQVARWTKMNPGQ